MLPGPTSENRITPFTLAILTVFLVMATRSHGTAVNDSRNVFRGPHLLMKCTSNAALND